MKHFPYVWKLPKDFYSVHRNSLSLLQTHLSHALPTNENDGAFGPAVHPLDETSRHEQQPQVRGNGNGLHVDEAVILRRGRERHLGENV